MIEKLPVVLIVGLTFVAVVNSVVDVVPTKDTEIRLYVGIIHYHVSV